MAFVEIFTLIFINAAALLLIYWLYLRRGASKFYQSCANIPLKNDHDFNGDKSDEK